MALLPASLCDPFLSKASPGARRLPLTLCLVLTVTPQWRVGPLAKGRRVGCPMT